MGVGASPEVGRNPLAHPGKGPGPGPGQQPGHQGGCSEQAEVPPHEPERNILARLSGNQHIVHQRHGDVGGHQRHRRAHQREEATQRGHPGVAASKSQHPNQGTPGSRRAGRLIFFTPPRSQRPCGQRFVARLLRSATMPLLPGNRQALHLRRSARCKQPTHLGQTGPSEGEPAEGRAHPHRQTGRVTQFPLGWCQTLTRAGIESARFAKPAFVGRRHVHKQSLIGQCHPAAGESPGEIEIDPAPCEQGFARTEQHTTAQPITPLSDAGCISAAERKPAGGVRRDHCGSEYRSVRAGLGLRRGEKMGPRHPLACGRVCQLLPFSEYAGLPSPRIPSIATIGRLGESFETRL